MDRNEALGGTFSGDPGAVDPGTSISEMIPGDSNVQAGMGTCQRQQCYLGAQPTPPRPADSRICVSARSPGAGESKGVGSFGMQL